MKCQNWSNIYIKHIKRLVTTTSQPNPGISTGLTTLISLLPLTARLNVLLAGYTTIQQNIPSNSHAQIYLIDEAYLDCTEAAGSATHAMDRVAYDQSKTDFSPRSSYSVWESRLLQLSGTDIFPSPIRRLQILQVGLGYAQGVELGISTWHRGTDRSPSATRATRHHPD